VSIRIMTRVWDARGIDDPGRRLVLLKLADCANDAGERAFPSVQTIADDCELGARMVQRHLRWLRDEGWIEPVAAASRYRPTEYRLCVDATGRKTSVAVETRGDIDDAPASASGVTATTVRGDIATTRRGDKSAPADLVPRSVIDPSVLAPVGASATTTLVETSTPTHPIKALLTEHERLFRQYVGQVPHYTGKDAKLAGQLIAQHGYDAVVAMLSALFTSLDPFVRQSGRDIAILSSCWNKLMVQAAPAGQMSENTTKTMTAGARWLAKQKENQT